MKTDSSSIPEKWQCETEILVPFYDVDTMEVAWHGNYVKYFEVARCQLLDQVNCNYIQMRDAGFGWPIVDIRLKYVRPALFNQRICVHAKIVEWEMRLKIEYLIRSVESGEVLTKGYSVQVAVLMDNYELLFATPKVFRDNLEAAAQC